MPPTAALPSAASLTHRPSAPLTPAAVTCRRGRRPAAPRADLSQAAVDFLAWGPRPASGLLDYAPGILGCSPGVAKLACWGAGCGVAATPLLFPELQSPGLTATCAAMGMMVGLELPAAGTHPQAALEVVVLSEYILHGLMGPAPQLMMLSPRARAKLRFVRLALPTLLGAILAAS